VVNVSAHFEKTKMCKQVFFDNPTYLIHLILGKGIPYGFSLIKFADKKKSLRLKNYIIG